MRYVIRFGHGHGYRAVADDRATAKRIVEALCKKGWNVTVRDESGNDVTREVRS